MNSNNESLKYFIGKICTIFTMPINRNFKEENPNTFIEQPYHYFLGVIEKIDQDGILVTQAMTGLKSYFFKRNIISISEEKILNPDDEKDAKVINEMKKVNNDAREKIKMAENSSSDYINVDDLDNLVKTVNQ